MFWAIYYFFHRRFQCVPHPENGHGNCLLQHIIYKILLNRVMRICHFVTQLTFYNPQRQSEVTPSPAWLGEDTHIFYCVLTKKTLWPIFQPSPSQFLSKVHNQKLAHTFAYHPFHIQKLSEAHLIKHKNSPANAIRTADEHPMSGPLNLYSGDAFLCHH